MMGSRPQIRVIIENRHLVLGVSEGMTVGDIVRSAANLAQIPFEGPVHSAWLARRTGYQLSLNMDTRPLSTTIRDGITVERRDHAQR